MYPKRADAFREWSKMMLEQATVPDRLQFKQAKMAVKGNGSFSLTKNKQRSKRRSRRKRRKRHARGFRRFRA